MQWDDSAYLLSKIKYNENSVIAEVYTEKHGKCSGIIFGASSKKIKNYLQIGNKLYVNYKTKNENKLGYFQIEISKAYSPLYFDSKKKLLCIISSMNLIKLLTADSQENKDIFDLIDNFFEILNKNNWITKYIFWELKLLSLIGYNIEFEKIAKIEFLNEEKKYYVESNKIKKYVPNFLVDKTIIDVDNKNLVNALRLVGDFLEKNILVPNNINYPPTRLNFINLFK
tara:strand:- start:213 stop:893 length:681 start_codon:yes stop_codon:yes gene_type:complete